MLIPKASSSFRIFSEILWGWWSQCSNKLGQVRSIVWVTIIIASCEEPLWLKEFPCLFHIGPATYIV